MRVFRLVIMLVLVVAGCDDKPIRTAKTNNKDIEVNILFDYDGCRGYSADVGSRMIYFVRCNGSVDTSWDEQQDKHTERVASRTEAK